MNAPTARLWIIRASLLTTGLNFTFFLIFPALGYPITFDQAIRLLEIVTPVYLAYFGSATYFLFAKNTRPSMGSYLLHIWTHSGLQDN